MLKLSKIAFKNIFRNKRRTLITLSIILSGSSALVVAGGFIRFMFDGLADTSIRNGLGHLQIYNPAYLQQQEEKPLQYGLDRSEDLAAAVSAISGVKGAAARIDFTGLLSNGEKSAIFLGTGVEPEKEANLGYVTTMKSGHDLTSAETKFQVLLTPGLAKIFNSNVGDSLTLMSTTAEGALNAVDVEVVGIFSTGLTEYDERSLRVPLHVARKLLDSNRVSKLVVGLQRTADTDRIYSLVSSNLLPGGHQVEIRRWYELATFYQQVVRMFSAIFTILGTIIFVLVVLSSSNTMLMAVFERVREIGTLMAFGTTRMKVLAIFITEGVFMGIIGGILGGIIAYFLILLLNGANLTMPPPPGTTTPFPILIPVVPVLFAGVFLLMVLTMMVASLIPAVRASQLKIVDALGHI